MKRKEVTKMKKEKIYVIYDYFYKTEDTAIDSLAFKDREKAIEYVESKLTQEEIEYNKKAKNRKLMCWFEFVSKDICYHIKEVDLV